ncbi:hypothetical protein [Salinicola sp. CPA57]|uniref:hypothetical protein n=1 Tax=unclassified Salinicola TaxID=2634022 RepID=UPI000DA15494|nr:hypothetical protein [Salinicola sp. CPA57]
MTFNDWVDEVGGIKPAATLLGEKHRSVRSWYHAERAPRQRSARNIIEKSGYRVDWSGIYQPIETARAEAEVSA